MFCSVDDEELTARLREIEQRQRRLDGERADVVAEWDRRRAWADDGSASAAARLARETSVSGRTARERVRIAGRLRDMPCTHGALDDLGWPKARLLADSINPRTAESFARDEEVLVEQAHRLSVDQLALFLCPLAPTRRRGRRQCRRRLDACQPVRAPDDIMER